MKKDKRDLILQSIIRAYLKDNIPIGSSELMGQMDVMIPASTIRVYFKQLSDEGAIEQIHVSSGRIPTKSAMVSYWNQKINYGKIDIKDSRVLDFLADKFDIFFTIFATNSSILKDVINYKDRYIIMDFVDDEIIIKFNPKIYKFLYSLVGKDINSIDNISLQVGLWAIHSRINFIKNSYIKVVANEDIAFKIYNDIRFKKLFEPDIVNVFSKNIMFEPYFPNGYMGILQDVVYDNKDAIMVCAGSVYEDYESFFNILMEAA